MFVLIANLMGLVPLFSTSTANFSVAFFILYFLFQMIEIYILHTNKRSGY